MFGQDTTQQSTQPADNPAVGATSIPGALPPVGFSMPSPSPDPTAAPAPAEPPVTPELPVSSFSVMPDPLATTGAVPSSAQEDLAAIKQQALEHLSPLVSHLEQTPEEKFRTTMMMIQASDNKDLIKDAFEAAQKITDDKARAQALLDVINEINYFAQKEEASS